MILKNCHQLFVTFTNDQSPPLWNLFYFIFPSSPDFDDFFAITDWQFINNDKAKLMRTSLRHDIRGSSPELKFSRKSRNVWELQAAAIIKSLLMTTMKRKKGTLCAINWFDCRKVFCPLAISWARFCRWSKSSNSRKKIKLSSCGPWELANDSTWN